MLLLKCLETSVCCTKYFYIELCEQFTIVKQFKSHNFCLANMISML